MAKFEGRPTWDAVRRHWLLVQKAGERREAPSTESIVASIVAGFRRGDLTEAEAVERFLRLLREGDVRPAA